MDRAGPMSQDRPPAHSHWAPSSHDSDPVLGIFVHLVLGMGKGVNTLLGLFEHQTMYCPHIISSFQSFA